MQFTDVIQTRRSIRKYRSDPIPDNVLKKLQEAIRLAPTGNNRQDFRFLFVKDPAVRREIVTQACHQDFLLEAPVLVVATCGQGGSFNAAIAVDHMVLAAFNEGLGACWIGWFEKDAVKRILGIPADVEVPILVPVGYPAENPPAKPRKPLEQIIGGDRY